MQRLYNLVVIDRYRPELGVKFSQPGAVFYCRLVHFHHPERFAEQPGGDETGLARNARLLPLREEAGVLPVVQVRTWRCFAGSARAGRPPLLVLLVSILL